MDDLVAKWQARLDSDFPQGLLATWDVPQGSPQWGIVYQVSRAEVVGQAGLDPVVALPVFRIDKLLRFRMLSYDVTQREPCLVVRVVPDGDLVPMNWSAGVSESLAERMAPQRKIKIDGARERGRSTFA